MKRTHVAIIGGCGHVGLPLGVMLAILPDFSVSLVDIDREKIDLVNQGIMPFLEEGMEPLLKEVIGKSLFATGDSACLQEAKIVVTVMGTPVDKHLNPILTETYDEIDKTINQMREDSLLVLRSTLYPGTTRLVYQRICQRELDIHVAVCPERIAEGKGCQELTTLPQIVAGYEPEAVRRAREFFGKLTNTIIELDPIEAELGKLFTNSWRYINFAVSNQFYILCQKYNLDFYRIYDAFKQDYPRMASLPRAGFAAGPCLLKDTLQLCAFSNNLFIMGHPAMVINESLPNFIIEQLGVTNLKNKRVAILGMAFKAESDDIRDSLSYKLRNLLLVYANEVLCTDPFVKDDRLVPLEIAVNRADIIILGTPHGCYADLKIDSQKTIIDIWGFWPRNAPDIQIESLIEREAKSSAFPI